MNGRGIGPVRSNILHRDPMYNSHFPLISCVCGVDHFRLNPLRCYFSITLRVQYPIYISFHDLFIQIPLRFPVVISIGASYGVYGFDCMPSDDGIWSESTTDTGHKCGTYMWFADLYIGKFDRRWHLRSDFVDWFVCHSSIESFCNCWNHLVWSRGFEQLVRCRCSWVTSENMLATHFLDLPSNIFWI